jgi:hypothetical protein
VNTAEVIALSLPSVVAGAVGLALRGALASRTAQGERLGRVEKWIDIENGRRAGFEEGLRAARAERGGDGR